MKDTFVKIGVGLLAWALVVATLRFGTGLQPHGVWQWLLFATLGPPIYVAAEIGESIGFDGLSPKHGRRKPGLGRVVLLILLTLPSVVISAFLYWQLE